MATVKVNTKPLPIPDYYKSGNTRKSEYQADISALAKAADEWKTRFQLKSVWAPDQLKLWLLVIDDQYDFTYPQGKLYVAGRSGTGAMDAQRNLVEFAYRYLHLITYIKCTMDTHLPYQIFFTSAHLQKDRSHPSPNTIISAEDYHRGVYEPNPAMARQMNADPVWLRKQFAYYCEQLEGGIGTSAGYTKHQLYLWDYHCMLGSPGHRLAGPVEELRYFHSFARGADNIQEIKGGNPLTEHYSVFSPEVLTTWDGRPMPNAQKNTALIKTLISADMVIIAGLASSHCVKESVHDFLTTISAQDPALVKKVYYLEDATAPVVIPGVVDFTADAEKALQNFKDAGMHVVKSTDPIESWPDVRFN